MEQEWKWTTDEPLALLLPRLQAALPALRSTPQIFRMRSHYFDTPTRALKAAQVSCRYRLENEQAVLCWKIRLPLAADTALLSAEEYECPATVSLPEFRRAMAQPGALLHFAEAWPSTSAMARFAQALGPVALTAEAEIAYTRRQYLLEEAAFTAELCLDEGERPSFQELELEFQSGDLNAFNARAADFAARFALRPSGWTKSALAWAAREAKA